MAESQSVTFTIGGQQYTAGPMVLYAVERADAHLAAWNGPDWYPKLDAALEIVSAALQVRDGALVPDAPSAEQLAMRLLPSEQQALLASTKALLILSGYEFKSVSPGEDAATTGSQETGAGSSPN